MLKGGNIFRLRSLQFLEVELLENNRTGETGTLRVELGGRYDAHINTH